MRDLNLSLQLRCTNLPYVAIGIDDTEICSGNMSEIYFFTADLKLDDGDHVLWVRTERMQPDQMVEIQFAEFEGIRTDRIKWQGVYEPIYPEPWASQQGELPRFRTGETCLGWDGIWRIVFSIPVFSWIHSVEHLGWLYR